MVNYQHQPETKIAEAICSVLHAKNEAILFI